MIDRFGIALHSFGLVFLAAYWVARGPGETLSESAWHIFAMAACVASLIRYRDGDLPPIAPPVRARTIRIELARGDETT